MRDLASCFSDYSVKISDNSCSSSTSNQACLPTNLMPSTQNAVTCLYKTNLSTQRQLLITVTWCRNLFSSQGLGINIVDTSSEFKFNADYRVFRRKKGNKSIETGTSSDSKVEFFWDLSMAKYGSGPEPTNRFYVVVLADSEVSLILGDMAEELSSKKFMSGIAQSSKFTLVSRRENFVGDALYSTKLQFGETRSAHDVLIRCEEESMNKGPVLSVCIDKKKVIRVKRLQWNFRGNRTIFVDGFLVDMMWDVHDWFFSHESGNAVFMFRRRSSFDSSLWLDDKERLEFSLLIYACRKPINMIKH